MDTGSRDSSTCLELALEGERLCKCGDFAGGIAFFEAAIKVGTTDMRTLSAIYSQLGNAYFYLNNYEKALNFHQLDLAIAKSMRDRVGEGKASGNLGNTLKMLSRFDEAIDACSTHLTISRQLKDQVGEGRALYNLGNVYHTKGKQLAKIGLRDPGDFPDDVKDCLMRGSEFYMQNLALMTQMGDKSAQGRALGNLGNTHYLLGNFREAIKFHMERLKIAQEFQDRAAERRARCNLGNARIFLGEFEEAVQDYEETLRLAHELSDKIMEAQACYSLGNTYTLLRDYDKAIEYHLRHLAIAQQLSDRVGEGRAYWSISNAYASMGRNEDALQYACKHLDITRETSDEAGQETAAQIVQDLQKVIREEQQEQLQTRQESQSGNSQSSCHEPDSGSASAVGGRLTPKLSAKRFSMDNMQLLKLTPGLTPTNDEAASSNFHLNLLTSEQENKTKETMKESIPKTTTIVTKTRDDNSLLDLVAQFQSKRMDDQRCSFDPRFDNKENKLPSNKLSSSSSSMTSTAAASSSLNAPRDHEVKVNSNQSNSGRHRVVPAVVTRTNRTAMLSRSASSPVCPQTNGLSSHHDPDSSDRSGASSSVNSGSRDSSCRDDLFDLIVGIQGRRMDEQRAQLPSGLRRANTTVNGPSSGHFFVNTTDRDSNFNRINRPAGSGSVDRHTVGRRGNFSSSRQMSLDQNIHPDDDFFDMLMRCQGSRLEDQRSSLPVTEEEPENVSMLKRSSAASAPPARSGTNTPPSGASTVPDDDFFSLILRVQSGRIDDQRSLLPSTKSGSSLGSVSSAGSSSATAASDSRKGSRKSSKSKK